MFGFSKRPVSLLLLLTYLPQITACHKTAKVEPGVVEPGGREPVVGVTRVGGRSVAFDKAGIVGPDSVYGQVHGSAVVIPLDSVERLWVRRVNEVQRVGLNRVNTTGERVVGVTTKDGADVAFDKAGGYVQVDTVFGTRNGERLRFPLDQVQRVWVRRTDAAGTALAVIGGLAGVFLLTLAVAAATKESCPFVYSWDGSQYVFDAEPYGGAISRGLERDDYGRLENLRPDSGLYKLLVTNEVNESQMTNLMELWVIDHAPGSRVIPDATGNLHLISNPIPPASARDQEGRDLRHWLIQTDRTIWEPLAVADSAGGMRDEIVLTFPRPAGATHARLIANVATGIWGSHMIRAMLQLRGREVRAWYARVDGGAHSRDSLFAWDLREELYHLRIAVEEPDGWRLRGVLPGGGPFIAEDRVVPLDLSRVRGDSVRLRFRPPRGFWALNSFAIDYGEVRPVKVDTLRPVSARDARAGDMLPAITSSDELYYAMPNKGDRGHVAFRAPAAARADLERTVILHTRGYYRLHLPIGGDPDTATLRRIVEVPNAAAEFAAEQFSHWHVAGR